MMDLTELDPGIRDVVEKLRAAGFETTDSGDGVSKPKDWYESGEALPFPHVAMSTTPADMVHEAQRAAHVLGDGWTVEASYSTHDRTAILFARPLTDQER